MTVARACGPTADAGRSTRGACAATSRSSQTQSRPLVFLDTAASAQKPRAVIDGVADFYRTRLRQRASRRLSAERSARPSLRGGAREVRASSTPPTRARSSSCAAPPRDQPRRPELGRGLPEGRRRGPDQRARAPLQHRAVADAARPHRHQSSSSRRSTRPAGSTWPRFETLLSAAHQACRDDPYRQRDRHAPAGRADHRASPTRAAPWC